MEHSLRHLSNPSPDHTDPPPLCKTPLQRYYLVKIAVLFWKYYMCPVIVCPNGMLLSKLKMCCLNTVSILAIIGESAVQCIINIGNWRSWLSWNWPPHQEISRFIPLNHSFWQSHITCFFHFLTTQCWQWLRLLKPLWINQ